MEENQEKDQPSEEKEKKSNTTKIVLGVAAAIFIAIAGYFYSSNNGDPSITENSGTDTQSSTETTATEAADEATSVAEDRTIDIEGGTFYFLPNEIRAKEGETITIKFNNALGTHDFVIDELDVQSEVTQTGETIEFEFVTSKAGEFEFYCSIGDHRSRGMFGTIIVEPKI